MLSHEGSAVAITGNFNLAVALATFGFPYRLERLRDDHSGDVVSCLWHIHPHPVCYSKEREDEPMPALKANTVKRMIEDGSFERGCPDHPIIDVLHGLNIYERIRTFMERGTSFRLVPTLAAGRYSILEGAEPAADVKRRAIQTESLEMASAMVRCGHPLLEVQGVRPHRRIVLGDQSIDPLQPSATALAAAINAQTLVASDPALWVICGLRNRAAMKAELDRDTIPRLIRNPRSLDWERRRRSAITRGEADGKTIDRARNLIR